MCTSSLHNDSRYEATQRATDDVELAIGRLRGRRVRRDDDLAAIAFQNAQRQDEHGVALPGCLLVAVVAAVSDEPLLTRSHTVTTSQGLQETRIYLLDYLVKTAQG